MSLFPQIASGAITSLPVSRSGRYVTRLNRLADLNEYRYADQANILMRWEVALEAIPDADVTTLAAFFAARNGKYSRFTFLDPLENLLKWSEDYSQSLWQKTGTFSLSAGQADPLGGTGATLVTDTSGVTNNLWQTIAFGPESQWFCSSVWLRAASPTTVETLQCSDQGAQVSDQSLAVGTTWKRFFTPAKFASSGSSVTQWLLRFNAGQALYVFGAQLAYLPGPGGYSKTTNSTGVHSVCRFDMDEFPHRATDFGANSVGPLTVIEISG